MRLIKHLAGKRNLCPVFGGRKYGPGSILILPEQYLNFFKRWVRNSMHPDHYLAIGKVLKAWGIKGKVKIFSYAESPETFHGLSELYVQGERGTRALELETVTEHKKGLLIKFKGRDYIEAVEDLIGLTLYMDKRSLLPTEEGEYYWFQLIGMTVKTDTGRLLGTIKNIMNTGSNDIYVVQQGEKELLIPALQDIIEEVDVDKQLMIISPMEGLLDDS